MDATNPTGGAMTMGGIEALAAEVGISPDSVKKAARSISTPSTPAARPQSRNWSRVLGAPSRLIFEREIDGEVPDAEFPVLVEEIRRILQQVGQVSQLGRTFSWTVTSTMGARRRDVEVSVSVRGGKTRIMVRENLGPLIGAVFGGIGGGMGGGGMGPIIGITVGALGLPPAAIAGIIPLWLATTYGIARTAYRSSVRKREEEFGYLVDRLAALAEELAVTPAAINPAGSRKLIR
jgi:hypothetical protein